VQGFKVVPSQSVLAPLVESKALESEDEIDKLLQDVMLPAGFLSEVDHGNELEEIKEFLDSSNMYAKSE
jgi:hypothetical protein